LAESDVVDKVSVVGVVSVGAADPASLDAAGTDPLDGVEGGDDEGGGVTGVEAGGGGGGVGSAPPTEIRRISAVAADVSLVPFQQHPPPHSTAITDPSTGSKPRTLCGTPELRISTGAVRPRDPGAKAMSLPGVSNEDTNIHPAASAVNPKLGLIVGSIRSDDVNVPVPLLPSGTNTTGRPSELEPVTARLEATMPMWVNSAQPVNGPMMRLGTSVIAAVDGKAHTSMFPEDAGHGVAAPLNPQDAT
jgi:hypothetical protein